MLIGNKLTLIRDEADFRRFLGSNVNFMLKEAEEAELVRTVGVPPSYPCFVSTSRNGGSNSEVMVHFVVRLTLEAEIERLGKLLDKISDEEK